MCPVLSVVASTPPGMDARRNGGRGETQNQAGAWARAAVTIKSTQVGIATAVESSTMW